MNPKVFLALAVCAIMAREVTGGAGGAVIWCPSICGLVSQLGGLALATALGALIGPAAVGPFMVLDGMGNAGCMAVCTGGSIAIPACFDQNAEVHVYGDTTKNIGLLRVGDSVGKDDTVLAVTVMQGEFDFFEIATDDGNKINVTSPHLMVTYLSNGTKMLQPAMKVIQLLMVLFTLKTFFWGGANKAVRKHPECSYYMFVGCKGRCYAEQQWR